MGASCSLEGAERTVIAVVKDIKYHSLGESPQPFLYLPMQQAWEPNTGIGLLVRTEGTAGAASARAAA